MRQPVAVIGEDIRTRCFRGRCMGRKLRVSGVDFTVIGLLEQQGSSFRQQHGQSGLHSGDRVCRVVRRRNGFGGVRESAARHGATHGRRSRHDPGALRTHFHAGPGKRTISTRLLPTRCGLSSIPILGFIAAIVVPVTSISLVVGGIVIMNIMLVSVTERTREIGIRKSLGAHQSGHHAAVPDGIRDSVDGRRAHRLALGSFGGGGLSALFGATLKITLPYVLLSIFVSTAVGVVSGWYPARRAARLDPVVALRAE